MAYHETGRSRTINLTLNAVEDLETGVSVTVSGSPSNVYWPYSNTQAFGCLFEARHQFSSVSYALHPDDPGTGPTYTWRAQVTVKLIVRVQLRGYLGLTTIETFHTGYSDYTTGATNPSTFPATATWIHTTPGTEGEDGLTGAMTVALVLKENLDDAAGTDPWTTLVEIPYSLDAEYSVSGQYKFSTGSGATVIVPISSSHDYGLNVLVSPSFLQVDEYLGTIYCNAALGVTNSLDISGDGLTYSGTTSGANGQASCTGSLAGFTLTMSGTTRIGEATLSVGPDWACEYNLTDYTYEDMATISGVERELYFGDGTLLTSGTGALRYPTSGWKSLIDVTVDDSSVSPVNVSNYQRLFNADAAALTSYSLWVRPSDAWGDSTGRYLGPGEAAWYNFRVLDSYAAGSFHLEGTHRYTFLDDVTKLFGTSCTISNDAGALKVTSITDPTFGNVAQLTPPTSTAEGGAPWRPFGYRHFRIRVKGPAGKKIRLQFNRFCLHPTLGTASTAQSTWDFTLATSDWEEHEFDFCMPTSYLASGLYPSDPTTLRFEQPADGQITPHRNTWTLRFPTANSSESYWVDWVEGFVKTGTERVLLLFPVSPDGPGFRSLDWDPQDNTQQSCGDITFPSTVYAPYRAPGGSLIVNGAYAFVLSAANGGLAAWFSAVNVVRGALASDVGITVQSSGHALNNVTHSNGWIIKAQASDAAELDLDTDVDLYAAPVHYTCGYYGMGNPRTGTYGELLEFVGERQWDGEQLGNAWTPTDGSVRGAPFAFHESDGTVIDSTVSDQDGLYRLFAPYGVPRPYSNTGASCAARQQYTGTTPDNYVYTTLGEEFAAYWLKGRTIIDRDGSDYASRYYNRDRYLILNQNPLWRCVQAEGVDLFNCDLVQLLGAPWWLRVQGDGTDAVVERSLDAGATWSTVETVAGGLDTGTYLAAPTLTRNRWDEVLLAFHNDSTETKLYLSTDLGETFSLHATHPGLYYPRVAVQDHTAWLSAHDGTQLCFYTSADWLATKSEVTALRITCPVQKAAFGVDRRGILHVLYQTAGGILNHRYSADGATWSSDTQVAAAGEYPAWSSTAPGALALYFNGSDLYVAQFEEDLATVAGTLTAPTGTWTPGYLGLWSSHREEYYLLGQIAPDLEVRYSPDEGASWSEPV